MANCSDAHQRLLSAQVTPGAKDVNQRGVQTPIGVVTR
jgi:hypothetical protein